MWSKCLNADKCKQMPFGSKNPGREHYIVNGNVNERKVLVLGVKTEAEKDLIKANDYKNKYKSEKAINRANYELGRMGKNLKFFNAKYFKIL